MGAARTVVYISSDTGAFKEDVKHLQQLGYALRRVQPFDPDPHRRAVLLVARLELQRPLAGAQDYDSVGNALTAGEQPLMVPGGVNSRTLRLGGGGFQSFPSSSRRS